MPKYRLLTRDELQNLEKEFIEYLILTGITGEDWVEMKRQDKVKAESILDLFSDVVFEKILRNVKYLERKDKQSLKLFKCDAEKIFLVGIDSTNQKIDFRDKESINQLNNKVSGLSVYKTSKSYNSKRELELFRMIENGCDITDNTLYDVVQSLM